MSERHRQNYWFIAVLLLAGGAFVSCRSKLDVQTKSGGEAAPATEPATDGGAADGGQPPVPPVPQPPDGSPPAAVVPSEMKDSVFVEGTKAYFQSTEPIVIRIKRSLFEGGDTFSVLNVTNAGTDDSKALVLVDGETPQAAFRADEGYEISESESDFLTVRFLPSPQAWHGRFYYSLTQPNKLKVISHSSETPRYSLIEVYLNDFNYFSMTPLNSGLAGLTESEDGVLRLWIDPVRSRAVRGSDGSVLMHGLNAAVFSN